jgi:hypothetical protein
MGPFIVRINTSSEAPGPGASAPAFGSTWLNPIFSPVPSCAGLIFPRGTGLSSGPLLLSSLIFRAPMAKRDSESTRLLSQRTGRTLERFRDVFDSRTTFRVLL